MGERIGQVSEGVGVAGPLTARSEEEKRPQKRERNNGTERRRLV